MTSPSSSQSDDHRVGGRRFDGQVAVITGASRGIGAAIAQRLAAEGARVVVGYRSGADDAAAVVERIRAEGGEAEARLVDVQDATSVDAFVEHAVAQYGRIDVAVANAGVIQDGLAATLTDDDWARVVDVNAGGAFRLARAASRPMLLARRGVVVLLSSVAATKAGRGQANYAASKGAVEAMTRALAVELARKGVRVVAVAPGVIETAMTEEVLRLGADEAKGKVLLGRFGQAHEVASAVAFLASDEASYITGVVLPVDGGFKMA